MNQRFDLEQLYFQAKESYYLGEPIMSDDEFDRMEQELINLGSISLTAIIKFTLFFSVLETLKYI